MTLRVGMAACVFRSVEMLAVARHAGFDFLIADMEHGAMSLGEAAALCVAGIEAGYPVQVRVPGPHSDYLTRAVDCGARGLIVPHVDSADIARHVVSKVRFPPRGNRSLPSPLAVAGFRPMPAPDLMERAEPLLEVLVMIESREGLAAASEIAAIDGIDGLLIGTNDLAQSLGLTGRLDHPDLLAAFTDIARAATGAGKVFGAMGLSADMMRSHGTGLGASWIAATNDINLLIEAGAACVAQTRALASG
jgi:4-hydroxy-2-oxoheptanedioate aldolase